MKSFIADNGLLSNPHVELAVSWEIHSPEKENELYLSSSRHPVTFLLAMGIVGIYCKLSLGIVVLFIMALLHCKLLKS